jgi:hypothetical protein
MNIAELLAEPPDRSVEAAGEALKYHPGVPSLSDFHGPGPRPTHATGGQHSGTEAGDVG